MKHEEITKGNKLIAEFMDFTWEQTEYGGRYSVPNEYYETAGCESFLNPMLFKFHKSWDWLMPVVEEIEKVDSVYEFGINSWSDDTGNNINNPIIYYNGSIESEDGPVFNICCEDRLEAVYKVIIKFIKWYNKTNKK